MRDLLWVRTLPVFSLDSITVVLLLLFCFVFSLVNKLLRVEPVLVPRCHSRGIFSWNTKCSNISDNEEVDKVSSVPSAADVGRGRKGRKYSEVEGVGTRGSNWEATLLVSYVC